MSDYIVCGKLDNRVDLGPFSAHAATKVRLHEHGLSPRRQAVSLSVSASEQNFWFDERVWDVAEFLSMAVAKGIQSLLVLTSKEYLHIVEQAAAYGLRVDVFEIKFPIFSGIKYSSRLRTNLDALMKHQRKLDQLGICSDSLSKDLANHHLRAVVKKLRFKNGYDRKFFFAYKDAYQEVFKLKEERSDRLIIALDFNSMYVESMKGEFCAPASIEYRDFRSGEPAPSTLHNGIYRVRLVAAKSSFLLDHHPFLYKRLGRSHHFQMKHGDTIETLLHKDEIEYFTQFFHHVEILEGLFSIHTIEHPLLKKGLNLYAQRMYHRRRGDETGENFCKISMQHLHSATNQKRFRNKKFDNIAQIRDFLSTQFAMNLEESSLDEMADFLIRHKYFGLERTVRGYQLSYLDTGGCSTVFSLSAQVVANARLKMLKTLEGFLSHRSVELCYANVDSIHLSIHRDEVEAFLAKNSNLISNQLGALKIEAIADKGYWFDVGRYWLKKDDQVVLFKNKGFNHKAALHKFVCRRKVSSFVETPTFSHLNTYVAKMENSFSYRKRLEHTITQETSYARFQYEEVKDACTANLTEAREQLSSMRAKVDLFRRISHAQKTIYN